MEVIIIRNSRRAHRRLHLGFWSTAFLAGLGLATVGAAYHAGIQSVPPPADPRPDLYAAAWQQAVKVQQAEVETSIQRSEVNLNALALRLGELQSHLIRIDALGERLVEVAALDPQEFGFGESPARGGPMPLSGGSSYAVPDFVAELEVLSSELRDRSDKLEAVQGTLVDRRLQSEVTPVGEPVKKGWISSFFGRRADPFSGKRSMHAGVDFAGRRNSEVVAVAAGVVRRSGVNSGFGKVVEVNHGNGYATRYAHNNKNLVKIGQKVKKGETIALMGSTGRTTGHHVHFEILKDGKPINPLKFIRGEID
jgi:murein DD-endopeptidase MepM/ murein hydrolase activator NlpD